jgi:hypothetical protein
MSVSVPMLGVARPAASSVCQSSKVLVLFHVRQQQILGVGDAHFAEAVALGEIGDQFHLGVRDVAGRHVGFLERYEYGPVARHLVRDRVVAIPGAKCRALPKPRGPCPAGCDRQAD